MSFRFAFALLPCLVLAGARDAHACGNDWVRTQDAMVAELARAKQKLTDGRLAEAALLAERIRYWSGTDDPRPELQREAELIIHTVVIRTDGAVKGKHEADSEKERLAALGESLRALRAMDPPPPGLRELEGEALARIPGRHEEARTILEELARKDLLTAPEPWAVLAVLRAHDAAPDETRVASAKHTCLARAARPEQCTAIQIARR